MASYIFNEVIESHITKYFEEFDTAASFDELKAATEHFIDQLLERSFVSKDKYGLYEKINQLLSYVTKFLKAFGIIERFTSVRSETGPQLVLNEDFPVEKTVSMIDNIWRAYERLYYQFLQLLDAHDELRGLTFKFDFNLFHKTSYESKLLN